MNPEPRQQPDADADALALMGGEVPEFSLALLRTLPDCIKLITPEGRLAFMSGNGMCAMKIPDFASIRGHVWWTLWPTASQAVLQDAVTRAAGGEVVRFEADCPTAAGEPRRWDVCVTPISGPEGRPSMLLAISRDVTRHH